MNYRIKYYIKKTLHTLSALFITGFLTLLPFTLTFSIFSFTFHLLKNLFAPLTLLQNKIPYLRNLPHAEIILAILLIFAAGIFLKSFIMQSLFEVFENQLNRIPFIRSVYNSAKQLVNAFSPKETESQKKVVLVEFPKAGNYAVGFMTSAVPTGIINVPGAFVSVFIPTSPNPTSGFCIMVPCEQIQMLDMNPQEAMALVISGGIIYPQKFLENESK